MSLFAQLKAPALVKNILNSSVFLKKSNPLSFWEEVKDDIEEEMNRVRMSQLIDLERQDSSSSAYATDDGSELERTLNSPTSSKNSTPEPRNVSKTFETLEDSGAENNSLVYEALDNSSSITNDVSSNTDTSILRMDDVESVKEVEESVLETDLDNSVFEQDTKDPLQVDESILSENTQIINEETEISPVNKHEDSDGDLSKDDDSLYNIDVKKLATSFLSSSDKPNSPSGIEDLPETLPSISQLMETYKKAPETKLSDTTLPDDLPSGVSLSSMRSAYEASICCNGAQRVTAQAEEEGLHINFSQMRDAYCNVISQSAVSSTPRVTATTNTRKVLNNFKEMEPLQVSSNCRVCGKQVFQMEKIVAEKASWHKSCFKCVECNKTLTLETYQSHEGTLYCKPHFKELFRPKAVVEDEAEARKERSTSKPDYGLDDITTCNVKERFSLFEAAGQEEEERKLEPVSVRRSQSMISRAAKFLEEQENGDHDEFGVHDAVLEEYEEESDEETEEEVEEEGVDEDGEPIIVKSVKKKKRVRPHAKELKNQFEKQTRRDEMTMMRKEELSRFRQMLCAGKNLTIKERFESGEFEENRTESSKEEIKIDGKRAAKSLKEKFEMGRTFSPDEDDVVNGNKVVREIEEVEEVFKEAETATKARSLFKQIDSKVNEDGSAAIMRSQSFASTPADRDNRRSMDLSKMRVTKIEDIPADIVRYHDTVEEEVSEGKDLASKFMFFATFEERKKQEETSRKKVFRMTPPRDGVENQGLEVEQVEVGRDPNLIKSTDNYEDDVDCRKTKSILDMFKKMEAKNCLGESESEDEEEGEGDYDDSEDYSEEEEYSEEYSEEEGDDEDKENGAQYKDEVLQMSAKKAANLRAKFEQWEVEEARQNGINKNTANGTPVGGDEEVMPSLDTARNLKAMFEEKAQEAAKPVVKERTKVNRFVGGGGDKCVTCGKTVYVMEKFEVQGKVIHKTCFKCCKCNSPLSMVTFSMGGGKLFCKSHYKQLFTEKGNYDQILEGTLPSTIAQQAKQ